MSCGHTYNQSDGRKVARGAGPGFCRDCNRKEINWERPLEGGPVKIVPQSAERQRAQADADMTGLGVLVDLKRVEPSRVILLRPQPVPSEVDAINEAIIAAMIAKWPRDCKRIQDIHIPEQGKYCVEMRMGESCGYRTISTYPLAQAALEKLT